MQKAEGLQLDALSPQKQERILCINSLPMAHFESRGRFVLSQPCEEKKRVVFPNERGEGRRMCCAGQALLTFPYR